MRSAAISLAIAIGVALILRWARRSYIAWRNHRDRFVPPGAGRDLVLPYEPAARERRL